MSTICDIQIQGLERPDITHNALTSGNRDVIKS